MPLSTKIFAGTALVVVAALGTALLVTARAPTQRLKSPRRGRCEPPAPRSATRW